MGVLNMKKWLLAIVFGSVLVLGACGGDDGGSDAASGEGESESVASDVEELVKDNCASCHSGDFELVPGDTGYSKDELVDIIKDGIGSMPAIDVSDDEATAIAEYLAD